LVNIGLNIVCLACLYRFRLGKDERPSWRYLGEVLGGVRQDLDSLLEEGQEVCGVGRYIWMVSW